MHLTQYASQVTIIHRRDTLRACELLQERARGKEKLSFRWNTVVQAIEGDDTVRRIQVEDAKTGERSHMEVSGVFLYIGLSPNTQFLNGLLPLNERGQIVTDLSMRTAVPSILAAGDVRCESSRQLVSAAGDGATAALAAMRYLRTGEWAER
jgi:thioredoxin reductase (NADPH)